MTTVSTSNSGVTVSIRPFNQEMDFPMVSKSYLETLWDFFYCSHVSRRVFNEYQPRVLEAILRDGQTWMACNKADPEQVFGCLIGEPGAPDDAAFVKAPILHLLYVKKPFRFLGIEEILLDQLAENKSTIQVAFSTKWTKLFLEEKHGAKANPYVLYSSAYL